jgi:Fe2+ transport system protein B
LVLNKIDLDKNYQKIVQKLKKESGKKVIPISAIKKENTSEVVKEIFYRI